MFRLRRSCWLKYWLFGLANWQKIFHDFVEFVTDYYPIGIHHLIACLDSLSFLFNVTTYNDTLTAKQMGYCKLQHDLHDKLILVTSPHLLKQHSRFQMNEEVWSESGKTPLTYKEKEALSKKKTLSELPHVCSPIFKTWTKLNSTTWQSLWWPSNVSDKRGDFFRQKFFHEFNN